MEPEVLDFLATRAKQRGTTVNQPVNQLLKKDRELIQAAAGWFVGRYSLPTLRLLRIRIGANACIYLAAECCPTARSVGMRFR